MEITKKYPDYDGYTNNCQNFGQYLVKKICPDALIPQNIRQLVQEKVFMQVCESIPAYSPHPMITQLPGAYPPSLRSMPISFAGTPDSLRTTGESIYHTPREAWSVLADSCSPIFDGG